MQRAWANQAVQPRLLCRAASLRLHRTLRIEPRLDGTRINGIVGKANSSSVAVASSHRYLPQSSMVAVGSTFNHLR